MARNKFLNVITKDETFTIASNSKKLYKFETSGQEVIRNQELFFEAIVQTFPLNPPPPTGRRKYFATQDSLFGGILGKDDLNVDVLWEHADSIPRKFLREKVQFFHDLAFSIAPSEDREKWGETGVILRLFLVCANKQSKDNIEKEFLLLDKLDFELE